MSWTLFLWIVLVVALVSAFVNVNVLRFERRVRREANELATHAGPRSAVEVRAALGNLPHPVARYLALAVPHGHRAVHTLRLRHGGVFRTAPDARFMRIDGVQYFTADPPGFVWWGRMHMAPGVWVDARDRLIDSAGEMRVLAESMLPLVDARGPLLDEGAAIRALGEMVWFPTALLDARYVSWSPIDDRSARATLRIRNSRGPFPGAKLEVSAVFHFGDDGMPTHVTAMRPREVNGEMVRTPWRGVCADFREVDGLRVPFTMESVWELESGPFQVLRFEVQSIELDPRDFLPGGHDPGLLADLEAFAR